MRHLVASIVALLAIARVSAAQVAPPTVRSIQVGRDTIRFFARADEYGGPEEPIFGFVRATRSWVPIGGAMRTTPRHLPWERRDAIRVAPGLRLVGQPTPGSRPPGFSRFALATDRGRRYPVEAVVTPMQGWAAASQDRWSLYDFALARPRVSASVTRWARGGDAVWFNAYGGGSDELGGLLRFDVRTRRFTVALDTLFDALYARAMAATPGAAWVAGIRYGSPEPEGGLYTWDDTRRVAGRITAATSPLPGDTVLALAATGDTVWIATTQGLALLDTRTGRWDVRWFRVRAAIDTATVSGMGYTNEEGNREFLEDTVGVVSVSFELSAQRPPGEAGRRLAFALADELRPRSDRTFTPDSFFALLARVPNAHFDSAAAGRHRLARALAHPEIIRRLVALDSANEDAYGMSGEGVAAIGLLGDRTYLPTLQAFPAESYGDGDFVAELALALARLGDTSRVAALRQRVGNGNLGFNDLRYAEALRATGDTAVLPALLTYVDTARYYSAFSAVRLFASPGRWRAIVTRWVDDPRMRDDLIDWTAHYDRADTVTDPVVRQALARGVRMALAKPAPRDTSGRADHRAHYYAVDVGVDLRDSTLLPALLPLLAGDETDWALAMRALIELTGVDTVPAPPRPTAAERATARAFWERWWKESGGRHRVVTPAEGLDALRKWRLRWELAAAR